MAVLQSLFCVQGYDNGRRFLLISLLSYLLILVIHPIIADAKIIYLLVSLLTVPIMATSSLRRVRDAQLANKMLAKSLTTLSFALFLVNLWGFASITSYHKWFLLIPAVVITVINTFIGSANVKRNRDYQFGYDGPISRLKTAPLDYSGKRIEPRVDLDTSIEIAAEPINTQEFDLTHNTYADVSHIKANRTEKYFHHWIQHNKKLAIILVVLLLLLLTLSIPSHDHKANTSQQQKNAVAEKLNYGSQDFHDKLKLPDQFWLLLDQNQAVTIAWEGDILPYKQPSLSDIFWSAYSGKGDPSCTNLHFGLGAEIKSLLVKANSSGDYYASFSPVDTQLIIQSIAEKDHFELCGYEFSLKGTRQVLRSKSAYRSILQASSTKASSEKH